MLQDLVKKLQDLISKCELVVADSEKSRREYEQMKFGLGEQKKAQDAKDTELKVREEKVKHIEGADKLYRDAQNITATIKSEKAALATDKANFDKYKTDANADIENRKLLLKRGEDDLSVGVKKLEEDRKTYKKKVVKEILSKGEVLKVALEDIEV
ncbi:MAG: hypothetical protein WC738_04340 [Candidatus Omnitrophota bacterium]|jgi:hypothetical protein